MRHLRWGQSAGNRVPGVGVDGLGEDKGFVKADGDVFGLSGAEVPAAAMTCERRGEQVVERRSEAGTVIHEAQNARLEVAQGIDDLVAEGCRISSAVCWGKGYVVK